MIRLVADIAPVIGDIRRRSVVAVLLAVAQAAFLLPIALLVRHIFDHDVRHDAQLQLVIEGALIAACYAASAAASLATRAYAARVTKESVGVMRRDLIGKLSRLPMSWHDRNEAGAVHAVVILDCERVDRMVNSLMSLALPGLLTGIGLALIALVLNPLLFAVLLVAVPIMVVATQSFARGFRRTLGTWHDAARDLSAHARLLLEGIATVRAAGAEDAEVERFNREIEGFIQAGCESAVAGSRYGVVQGAVATVAGVAVLVVGGILVAQHAISVGSLIAFYSVVALIIRQLSMVLGAAPSIFEGAIAARRVSALIATDEPQAYRGARRIVLRGKAELRDVTFSYEDRPALRDVSLVVEPGDQIAVMGPNGAGKSTLLALVLGLYRPSRGSVLIDDVAVAELDLPALRRQMGVVLQDASLFPGTLRDNITLGASDVSDDDVAEAVHVAEGTALVEELPDGLDTRIAEGGIGLSGGQRQRLAIARAVVGRPALLLLDEPTANLPRDVSTRIMRNLCQLPWNPSLLVITHDPAVAVEAKRILRLESGRLSEGEELLSRRPSLAVGQPGLPAVARYGL